VVQVSGGALARTKQRRPVNQDQIHFFGEIGSTQFLEQGLRPALFFIAFSSDVDTGSSEGSASNKNARKRHHGVTHLIQRSIELAAGI
jgi:hypothetical protein